MRRTKLAAFVAAVVTISTLAAAHSNAASVATPTSHWPTWVAKPTPATCQAGEVPLVPTSATTDTLGVVHFRYSANASLVTSIPPRDFKRSTAAPDLINDLHQSGLTDQFLSRSSALTTPATFCESSPTTAGAQWSPISNNEGEATPVGDDSPNTHFDNSNWAGYTADGTWDGASGQWNVEQSAPSQLTPNREDTWVGIGGNSTDVSNYGLIQVGTEMQTNLGYRSWFEYVCGTCGHSISPTFNSAYGVTFSSGSSTVHNGDTIWALVYWASSTEACFNLDDQTRSTGSISGCINNMPIPYDRHSMEWIDESHYWQTGTSLSNFGSTGWSNQYAFNATTGNYSAFTNYPLVGNILANPNTIPIPPCTSSSNLMAYPENASGTSSDTVFCRQT